MHTDPCLSVSNSENSSVFECKMSGIQNVNNERTLDQESNFNDTMTREQMADTICYRFTSLLINIVFLLLLIGLSISGALLYRLRGGWYIFNEKCQSYDCQQTWGILLHNGTANWLCGLAIGFIGLLSINVTNKEAWPYYIKHMNIRILLFIVLTVLMSFSFYVGMLLYYG